MTISQQREGDFEKLCQDFKIIIHALPEDLKNVKVGEETIKFSKGKDRKKEVFEIKVNIDFEEIVLDW